MPLAWSSAAYCCVFGFRQKVLSDPQRVVRKYHSADYVVVAFITPSLANNTLCLFQDLEFKYVVAFSHCVFGP